MKRPAGHWHCLLACAYENSAADRFFIVYPLLGAGLVGIGALARRIKKS